MDEALEKEAMNRLIEEKRKQVIRRNALEASSDCGNGCVAGRRRQWRGVPCVHADATTYEHIERRTHPLYVAQLTCDFVEDLFLLPQ